MQDTYFNRHFNNFNRLCPVSIEEWSNMKYILVFSQTIQYDKV